VNAIGDAVGWIAFFGIAAVGLAVTYLVTQAGRRRLRRRGAGQGTTVAVTALIFVVAFLGGWLPVLVYWAARKLYGHLRRPLRPGSAKDAL
jgi:dolichyl-phosphate-mannose--protein O-mannosyl transferase